MADTRKELLTWKDVDALIDCLIPQFTKEYDCMLMITRGGIVPGGLLTHRLGINLILNVALSFPDIINAEYQNEAKRLIVWPAFLQFPEFSLLTGKKVLIVDNVWGSGRTITAVKNRVSTAGGIPFTCVLHFNPYRNLFGQVRPDYYAATTDAFIIYPWEIDRGLTAAI